MLVIDKIKIQFNVKREIKKHFQLIQRNGKPSHYAKYAIEKQGKPDIWLYFDDRNSTILAEWNPNKYLNGHAVTGFVDVVDLVQRTLVPAMEQDGINPKLILNNIANGDFLIREYEINQNFKARHDSLHLYLKEKLARSEVVKRKRGYNWRTETEFHYYDNINKKVSRFTSTLKDGQGLCWMLGNAIKIYDKGAEFNSDKKKNRYLREGQVTTLRRMLQSTIRIELLEKDAKRFEHGVLKEGIWAKDFTVPYIERLMQSVFEDGGLEFLKNKPVTYEDVLAIVRLEAGRREGASYREIFLLWKAQDPALTTLHSQKTRDKAKCFIENHFGINIDFPPSEGEEISFSEYINRNYIDLYEWLVATKQAI